MQRRAIYIGLLLISGCSAGRSRDPGAGGDAGARADSGAPPVDAGATTPDAGAADSGEADGGQSEDPPLVILQLRELDVVVFGGAAVASAVLARPAAVVPESGCVRHLDAQPPLPSIGTISALGLTVTELVCFDDASTGVDGERCLGQGAAPPPIPGSTMDTGPWLDGRDVTLSVSGGAGLGAASGTLSAPSPADILEPAALSAVVPGDLTLRWTALGHTDVLVEVEVVVGGQTGLVICAPDTDGAQVVPADLLGDRVLRVAVGTVARQLVRDPSGRGVEVQLVRGRMLAV